MESSLEAERNAAPEIADRPVNKTSRLPIARRGFGSRGKKQDLLTNHFSVDVNNSEGHFFHYSVSFFYEDGRPLEGKGVGRRIMGRVQETYASTFEGKDLAYDGEKSLFTLCPLSSNKLEFTVVFEDLSSTSSSSSMRRNNNGSPSEGDKKRMRRHNRSKGFKVDISYAAMIPLQAITNALRGQHSQHFQEAIRVLDIVLRQHAAKQGCLLVRQSYFPKNYGNIIDIGGGVLGFRGFHSSFRTTLTGLSLNIDVSTTTFIRHDSIVDFLIAHQNVEDPSLINWRKAEDTLRNLRIKTIPANQEYKITGLSDLPCNTQRFSLKNGKDGTVNSVTVYDYFVNHKNIHVQYSADFPCVNVGKAERPIFFPLKLCPLVSLQRYPKSLSTLQRSLLREKSMQKPQEQMRVLSDVLKINNYEYEPMFHNSGISITNRFTQVKGRVLAAPVKDKRPLDGKWDLKNKKVIEPSNISNWAVVNFSAHCNPQKIVQHIIKCGRDKGLVIEEPKHFIEESREYLCLTHENRVNVMLDILLKKVTNQVTFVLCFLPEKNSDIYGLWKRRCLIDGIVNQCIAPVRVNVNNQYVTNLLLKINVKLGGLNSKLSSMEQTQLIRICQEPTIVLGMDVSHGPLRQPESPSVAAVVGSICWPLISKYMAVVRTQSPKVEIIDTLFKPVGEGDKGMIRELMMQFYKTSGKRKPENIIIFRDGVSESQFSHVLNIELNQIIEACKCIDDRWIPKFVVIVAQKNHHTKFFLPSSSGNVPPGTIIDNGICHPQNYDFYLCAHAGMIGTTRPVHYHVLLDEANFSPDDLETLVHSLSYVYQRSTTAISVVAPVRYAHLAATQMRKMIKFEKPETSSSHGGQSSTGLVPVPQLPNLNEKVRNTMFFC